MISPRIITNEGVSLVSTSASGFVIIMHHLPSNTIWTLNWEEPAVWDPTILMDTPDPRWVATSIPAYSFVGASTRSHADAQGTTTFIDIVYDKTGLPQPLTQYFWNVSRDNGITWHPEPYTNETYGDGYFDKQCEPFSVVSPRYNRMVLIQECSNRFWQNSFRLPSNEKIGVFNQGTWALDADKSFSWNAADMSFSHGTAEARPVSGDWNGDGITETGTFSNAEWLLDYNGNGVYDGPEIDRTFSSAFPVISRSPVTGTRTAGMKSAWNLTGSGPLTTMAITSGTA